MVIPASQYLLAAAGIRNCGPLGVPSWLQLAEGPAEPVGDTQHHQCLCWRWPAIMPAKGRCTAGRLRRCHDHGAGQSVPGAALLKRPYPDKKWTSTVRQAGIVSEAKGIY